MLARGTRILLDARRSGRAVPAFTTYTLESTRAICEAAERPACRSSSRPARARSGQLARDARRPLPLPPPARRRSRRCAPGPLDRPRRDPGVPGARLHVGDVRRIAPAVRGERGAHPGGGGRGARRGRWVEAELGGVAGDEDASTSAEAGELTDPDAGRRLRRADRRRCARCGGRHRPRLHDRARAGGPRTACARSRRGRRGSPSSSTARRASPDAELAGGGRRRRGEGEHQRRAAAGLPHRRSTGETDSDDIARSRSRASSAAWPTSPPRSSSCSGSPTGN